MLSVASSDQSSREVSDLTTQTARGRQKSIGRSLSLQHESQAAHRSRDADKSIRFDRHVFPVSGKKGSQEAGRRRLLEAKMQNKVAQLEKMWLEHTPGDGEPNQKTE